MNFAGDISFEKIILTSTKNEQHDISGLVTNITIYEDVFNPALTGSISILDTTGLMVRAPIIGEEKIKISFITPTFDEKFRIEQEFFVYKITNILHLNPHKISFTLMLATSETITDISKKISRPIFGNSTSSIRSLLKDEYGLNSPKPFDGNVSPSTIKFVSPYWSPFKCINWIATNTIDYNGRASFLFFETNRRFRFSSLGDLFAKEPSLTYFYDFKNLRATGSGNESERDIDTEMKRVIDIAFTSKFNLIDNNLLGMYSKRVFEITPLLKRINQLDYSYKHDFGSLPNIARFPIEANGNRSATAGVISTASSFPFSHKESVADLTGTVNLSRKPILAKLNLIKFEIEVHGRSDIEVGDVINFNYGKYRELGEEDLTEELTDPYFSGKYFVTAIAHHMSLAEHKMKLEIVKDSSEEDFFKEQL